MDTSKKFQLHLEQLEVSTFDPQVPSAMILPQEPNQIALPQNPRLPTPNTYCFVCD
jgi:hypothetical protein